MTSAEERAGQFCLRYSGDREGKGSRDGPMWTHSAPCFIMRLISLLRSPKLDARTEGEMIGRGEAMAAV